MEAKFGPLEKKMKKFISIEIKYFSEEQPVIPFVTPREMRKFCKS
jgi:hypothetical protein